MSAGSVRRRLTLSSLAALWASAMLVLGLRLITHPAAGNDGLASPGVCLGLALSAAGLAIFAQQVANRLFPARARRVSDAYELTTGAVFILSLAAAAVLRLGA